MDRFYNFKEAIDRLVDKYKGRKYLHKQNKYNIKNIKLLNMNQEKFRPDKFWGKTSLPGNVSLKGFSKKSARFDIRCNFNDNNNF